MDRIGRDEWQPAVSIDPLAPLTKLAGSGSRGIANRQRGLPHDGATSGSACVSSSCTPAFGYTSPSDGGCPRPAQAQIRDAEMSVDFLCKKFESLSEQLRREERAREDAERYTRVLTAEVDEADEAVAKRYNALSLELSSNDTTLTTLRASASGAGQLASLQATRAQDEEASNRHFEHLCQHLAEEYREETARCERMHARAAAQDREAAQESREYGDLRRRLRAAQTDVRVITEDLRIAQQRALLVRNEHQALEMQLDSSDRSFRTVGQESETHVLQILDKNRQLREQETKVQALVDAIESVRGENVRRDKRLAALKDEDSCSQDQMNILRQEVQTAKEELTVKTAEMFSETETTTILDEEFLSAGRQRSDGFEEATVRQRRLADSEATLEKLRHGVEQAHISRDALSRHLDELNVEEKQHAATVSGLRRTRHAEDLAFEDVQAELQTAFQKHECMSDDLNLQSRARDALKVQLRRLQPEIAEADEHCCNLEAQLAEKSRELEDELVQQRHSQQETSTASESLRRLQRQEMLMESELRTSGDGHGCVTSSSSSYQVVASDKLGYPPASGNSNLSERPPAEARGRSRRCGASVATSAERMPPSGMNGGVASARMGSTPSNDNGGCAAGMSFTGNRYGCGSAGSRPELGRLRSMPGSSLQEPQAADMSSPHFCRSRGTSPSATWHRTPAASCIESSPVPAPRLVNSGLR
eukprot:TRINITY_DN15204_c0_g1_i1.p1 TRINITY_DN15204_c0_g1~~TRINITY_DN15204_c0_g1_i1.p1  ORF type:complete len:707 (+),score=153.49 TRINITY_DN15204_c0_g1_i1:52-2172(+)